MNGFLGISVLIGISALIGYFIPGLAHSFASYKSVRKGYLNPQYKPGFRWKGISTLFTAGFVGMSGFYLPDNQILFTVIICYIAVFGFFVDMYIRIIANEMLWVILAVGLTYRMYIGGLRMLFGSAGAMLLVIIIFGITGFFTFAVKGIPGIGMGDVKLAMVIAITVGWPGVIYFLTGMAGTIGLYCLTGMKCGWLVRESTFPMCGHIMAGFLFALLWPYISMIVL